VNKLYELVTIDVSWNKDTDVDTMRLRLMKKYSLQEIEEVRRYIYVLSERLVDAGIPQMIEKEAGYYGDSVYDCICELLAHGERFVDMIIEKPELAVKMYTSGNYTENFLYVLPHKDDYEMMNHDYHKKDIDDMLKELEEFQSKLMFKYNTDYLQKKGGYDFDMAKTVLQEVQAGFKNDSRSYNEIYNATKNIGACALYANTWGDFMTFCQL
jgi:hypothetical protein